MTGSATETRARQWLAKRGHIIEARGTEPCSECGHAPFTEADVQSMAALIEDIRDEPEEGIAPSTHVRIATVARATQDETVDVATALALRISGRCELVFWLVDDEGKSARKGMAAGPVHLMGSSAFEMTARELRELRRFVARFLAQEA